MAIKKKYLKVLKEINATIPKELLDQLIIKVKETPAVAKVIDLALADPDFDPEKKRKLQNIKDTGMLEREVEIEDDKVRKKIEKFVNGEIKRKIKLGLLPEDRELLLTKATKYGKKYKESN